MSANRHIPVRGGKTDERVIHVVSYTDFLCPYCRRFRTVLKRLRQAFGDSLAYSLRHFPIERIHPGATFASLLVEAAGRQGLFWEMHDRLFDAEPPFGEEQMLDMAREVGADMERLKRDLADPATLADVKADIAEGRQNGVSGTPTIFVDGARYDGAWDFYSLANAFQQPVAERIRRSAHAFASLPASGGLALLVASALALICANTPLAGYYHAFIGSHFGIGPADTPLSLTIGDWFSEGLLAFFFLLVGLEIRREMTAGALSDLRAALLPVIAAIGGGTVPALVYLLFNRGDTAAGWAVPTATDIAFVLGVLALLGDRVPPQLRVFIAAFAVMDDIVSVLTLAIFYPHNFEAVWLLGAGMAMLAMYALNRGRVYTSWPYVLMSIAVWFCLHAAGVHGALAGIVLAGFIPTRPAPDAAPLLAQAANALSVLEIAQSDKDASEEDRDTVIDWAGRNLSAASERLLSPADRVERAVAPWSTYFALPLFAFSAAGVSFNADLSAPGALSIMAGVVLGLVIGKPLGIGIFSLAAVKAGIARAPKGVGIRTFIGALCLCGIGDTVALLLADQAFPQGADAAIAKIAVLIGSVLSAALGAAIIAASPGKLLGGEQTPA
ncbi:MAG TPA: Na+/H+ antiporter NhaA [Rhizomicrobium sp.]|jgi:NhaA family Na+:H+ antiporter|nr:Na+/H+ antiporter NhaA [Rhizomicrobium sp.]